MAQTERSHGPEQLDAEQRRQLRRAHERLRAASKELEALIATEPIKGRWEPEPPPPEILAAARAALGDAYEAVVRRQHEILGWEPPSGAG
ncbi:MAG TPA: hypothetical protein VM299_00235 [Solirubrobacteraceae bacterium]|nr:hypothetical protein [Solirubrobacteraceae bacterium]